jgi:hypothetical protein
MLSFSSFIFNESLTIMYPVHLGLKIQALSGLLLVCLFLPAANVFARMVLLRHASCSGET